VTIGDICDNDAAPSVLTSISTLTYSDSRVSRRSPVMRLSPSRFASHLSLGVILSMALLQAGAAIDIDGVDRDLHVRVTRVGAQRLDTDNGHVAGDVEGAALSVAEQAAADQGLALAAPPMPVAAPAAPVTFVLLPELSPALPVTVRPVARPRDRAPPAI
jgi:hypothetical protein